MLPLLVHHSHQPIKFIGECGLILKAYRKRTDTDWGLGTGPFTGIRSGQSYWKWAYQEGRQCERTWPRYLLMASLTIQYLLLRRKCFSLPTRWIYKSWIDGSFSLPSFIDSILPYLLVTGLGTHIYLFYYLCLLVFTNVIHYPMTHQAIGSS